MTPMTPMQQEHGIFMRLYSTPVVLRLICDSLPICLLANPAQLWIRVTG